MKTTDAPVSLLFPFNQEIKNSYIENQDNKPKEITVTVKSDIMESYENGSVFSGKHEIISLVCKDKYLVTFSIGTDGRLYMIKKDSDENEFWVNKDISARLIEKLEGQNGDKKLEVVTFNAIHLDIKNDSIAVICCIAEVENHSNYTIWYAPIVASDNSENSDWESLGKVNDIAIEFIRMGYNTSNTLSESSDLSFIACGRKKNNGYIYSYIYNKSGQNWDYLQLGYDIDSIIDLQFGVSPVSDFGVYVLGTFKEKEKYLGRFIFISIDTEPNKSTSPVLTDFSVFTDPKAFIAVPIDDPSKKYYGCSEIYLADGITNQKGQIKFMSAQAQVDLASNPSSAGIIEIGNSFGGEAKRIFATKNEANRIDLYTHVVENNNGNLLHIFNSSLQADRENKWSPVYTLEKNVSVIAPACNRAGKVCEVFILGKEDNDLHYIWQDDKLFAWNRDLIRVQSTGNAVPTKCVQTKITFADAKSGVPVIFQQYTDPINITVESSRTVNLQIGDKKYTLYQGCQQNIETKELAGELSIITNLTEADSPYFTIRTNLIANGELVVHPVAKIQDDMKSVDNQKIKSPKDRFGNSLKVPLVEGEKATDKYLNGILPGINKLATISGCLPFETNLSLVSNSPDISHLQREGVWIKEKSSVFSTQLDLSSIPDGILFAIDYRNEFPLILTAEQCNEQGLKGIGYDNSIWDDLAHFFGPFIEAVKNTAEKVLTFIVEKVEGVLVFTINFLEEAISCVIKYAEQVLETINMVLVKYLGIDLSKIIGWLGAIFDIEYIKATQQLFAARIEQTISKIKDGAHSANEQVNRFFDKIKSDFDNGLDLFTDNQKSFKNALNSQDKFEVKRIFSLHSVQLANEITISTKVSDKKWFVEDAQHTYVVVNNGENLNVSVIISIPNNMKNMTLNQCKDSITEKAEGQLGKTPEEVAANKEIVKNRQASLKSDPVLSWGINQFIQSPSTKNSPLSALSIEQDALEKVTEYIKEKLYPLADSSEKDIKNKAKEMLKFMSDSSRTLLEIFEYITGHIVNFGLDLARALMSGFLEVVKDVVCVFEGLMTTELDIPVIKSLFTLIFGSKVKFSPINICALILALPTTIFCKLAGIKIPATDSENKIPEIYFHVMTWGGLVAEGIQYIVSGVGMVANWISSLEPTHEGSKLTNVVNGINTLLIVPFRLFLSNPFTYFIPPVSPIDWADVICTQIRWWTGVIDGAFEIISFFTGGIIPALAGLIVEIFFSAIMFCVYIVEDTIMMTVRIIKNSIELDIWRIIQSVFDIVQKTAENLSRASTSMGNVLFVLEPVEALIKLGFHGVALIGLAASFDAQAVLAVGETVHYYLKPEE